MHTKQLSMNKYALFAAYAKTPGSIDLLRLLTERASVAEEVAEKVVDAGPLDTPLLPYLASDVGRGPAVEDGDEVGQRAHDAVLTNVLCVLAECVAGNDPSDEARGQVVEAAESVVLPVARHVRFVPCSVGDY